MNEKFHSFDKHIMIGFEKNREPFIGMASNFKLWCRQDEFQCSLFNAVFLNSVNMCFKDVTGSVHVTCYQVAKSQNMRMDDRINGLEPSMETVVCWTLKLTHKNYPISACFASNNHVQQSMSRKGTFYDHRLCTSQHPRPKSSTSSGRPGESRG